VFSPEQLGLLAVLFVLAGTVKGFVGIGLPTFVISVASIYLDPRLAIALMLIPTMLSNAWLAIGSGKIQKTAQRYYRIAIPLIALTWIFAQLSAGLNEDLLRFVIGVVVILFAVSNAIVQTSNWKALISPHFQWGLGVFSGILGGLTSLPGTPLIMYLLITGEKKDEFVAAISFLLLCASIPLTWGYYQNGLTDNNLLIVSLMFFVPAAIGLQIGARLRKKINPQRFHTAILIVFFLLGVNLIRSALA